MTTTYTLQHQDGAARAANIEVDESFIEGAADATFEDGEL